MTVTAYDTHSFVKILTGQGLTEPQAEAIVRVVAQMRESDLQSSTTKADLRELELRLQAQLKDLQIRIGSMIFALGGILIAIKYFG
jgi:hypothetical protein